MHRSSNVETVQGHSSQQGTILAPDIRPVKIRRDLKQFIKFPWRIYRDYPNWVPPLIVDRLKLLDEKKNPFFKHAEMQLFLAERRDEIAGRIGAIIDHNYIDFHQEKVGFFGFFETVDDLNVAKALVETAKAWLGERGMTKMVGPMNPSTNGELGLLIEGFQYRPAMFTPYNPPYYATLLEQCGLEKLKDLHCYHLDRKKVLSDKLIRVTEAVRKREKLLIRDVNMKKFDQEVAIVRDIYNRAWSISFAFSSSVLFLNTRDGASMVFSTMKRGNGAPTRVCAREKLVGCWKTTS